MATPEYESSGEWLRRWRKEADMTQIELGEAVGVSKQHISNLERGQPHGESGATAGASIEVIDKLAKVLKRPVAEAREVFGIESEKKYETPDASRALLADQAGEAMKILIEMSPEERAKLLAIMRAASGQDDRRPIRAIWDYERSREREGQGPDVVED